MTAQPPLPVVAQQDAVPIGAAAALVTDEDGGRVFVHGQLVMAWEAGDEACRRLAAVQLVTIKAATTVDVAAGFGIDRETLRRWRTAMTGAGAAGLVPAKTGPKGPSVLVPEVVAQVRARRAAGQSLRAVAAALGISTNSVRRAQLPATAKGQPDLDAEQPDTAEGQPDLDAEQPDTAEGQPDLDAEQPDTAEGQPDLDAEQPDTAEGQPDLDAEQPDPAGGQPGPAGGQPGPAGGQPGPGEGELDSSGSGAAAGVPPPQSGQPDLDEGQSGPAGRGAGPAPGREQPGVAAAAPVLPVLPPAVDRMPERVAARFGLIEHAAPVFAPAARVPLAGLLLALPGLQASGLLSCARNVFGALPNGFYGLDTVLLEAVLRTLVGEARAEGATRIDPVAFGRVLGMDRAPEVKTIRRKLRLLAATGQVERLVAAMAATHLARPDADPGDAVGMVLYVDGHVRTYHGTRKIGKTHVARLKFPAPATVETWVGDAHGDPVLVVMAAPGASLAGELRRLVPDLRAAVGDERRVLVGFDRGGWSPALFKHLHSRGFDVLTWRKGPTADIDPDLFTDLTFTDPDTGREHTWRAADTTVTLTLTKPKNKPAAGGPDPQDTDPPEVQAEGDAEATGTVFTMRQVTLAVPATKHTKKPAAADSADAGGDSGEAGGDSGEAGDHGDADGGRGLRQIHILTTRTDLPTEQVIHRMGSRWRQENGFRYGRMHFHLDSHDSYAATDDDPDRPVPNPAKKRAYQQVLTARARLEQAAAATDAALLAAKTPAPGVPVLLTNQAHDALTAGLRQAEAALIAAEAAHAAIPTRLPLGQVNPGQQALDTQVKLLTHAIRIAAFNTDATLARQLRLHTGYSRKKHEAHTLIRQALTGSGDIDPSVDGVLTIRLDPLPTRRASTAIGELCEHLTATKTRYPGTDLILRYEIKTAS